MVSEEAAAVLNNLRSEKAAGSGTQVEICFKLLKRVSGHLRGRSAQKKEILAVENLRAIVELEKHKSTALEEKFKEVTIEQDEMKKCMGLMMKEIQRLSKPIRDNYLIHISTLQQLNYLLLVAMWACGIIFIGPVNAISCWRLACTWTWTIKSHRLFLDATGSTLQDYMHLDSSFRSFMTPGL
nr:hypothetical protein [Tanacetum cinerariifolium]